MIGKYGKQFPRDVNSQITDLTIFIHFLLRSFNYYDVHE